MPKGQALICNLIAMQHDASLWQTPEAFQPERWLDPSPGAAELRQHAWKPFGAGAFCPFLSLSVACPAPDTLDTFRSQKPPQIHG